MKKLIYLLISTGLAFIMCFATIPVNAEANNFNPNTGVAVEVAIPEIQEGESIALEPIPVYVLNDLERSSTRIIDIIPTFNKISSSKYTVTLTLRLLIHHTIITVLHLIFWFKEIYYKDIHQNLIKD